MLQVVKGHSSHCRWRGSPSSNPPLLDGGRELPWGYQGGAGSYQQVTRGEQELPRGSRGLPEGAAATPRGSRG